MRTEKQIATSKRSWRKSLAALALGVAVATAGLATVSAPAKADYYGWHRGWHHHYWGPRFGFTFVPPYYYSPYNYYSPYPY